jgi:hypothetical protein
LIAGSSRLFLSGTAGVSPAEAPSGAHFSLDRGSLDTARIF